MIIFTPHALQKLQERDISKEKVLVIKAPDFITKTHFDRSEAFKKFGKLHLKVIFKNRGRDIIITQHWAEKL